MPLQSRGSSHSESVSHAPLRTVGDGNCEVTVPILRDDLGGSLPDSGVLSFELRQF